MVPTLNEELGIKNVLEDQVKEKDAMISALK